MVMIRRPRSHVAAILVLAVITSGLAGCAPVSSRPMLAPETAGSLSFTLDDGVSLTAELTFPPAAGARVPAVVLMHGCSGLPTRSVTAWQPLLVEWGYATLVVDSFTGRDLRRVCGDALRLMGTERVPDAYAALALLARHPRIDADRVALFGFSHGGIATLASASSWARRRYAPLEGPGFALFVPFYPYCNAVVPEMTDGLAGPVRVHIGELDDWTPARTCQDLAALARAAGYDMRVTVYAGARHGFDAVGLAPVIHQRGVDNAASCTPRLASMMGPILNLFELRSCMKKGATVGHDPAATAQARATVREDLSIHLGNAHGSRN